MRYCCSILLLILFVSCIKLSNETYHHLSIDERRKLSADYTQLAQRLETGSPDYMTILEKAVRVNDQNDLAWRELSLPYLYTGEIEKWSRYIEKAIELNPEAWQAWRGYDRLFYFRDYAGALFDLDASDTLTKNQVDYPSNVSVDYLRGLCYLGLEDYPKSKEYFNKFIEDEKIKVGDKFIDESAFLYLGIIANYEESYTKAISQFERGILYEEGMADFHFHWAKSLCFLGRYEEAHDQIMLAKSKFLDNNYFRRYRVEAIEQIYLTDIIELEEDIIFSLSIHI